MVNALQGVFTGFEAVLGITNCVCAHVCVCTCVCVCVCVCVHLDAEFEFVYQVRLDWLPLPCMALIRPSQLGCLGSSFGRASAS